MENIRILVIDDEAVSYTHLDVYKRQVLDCPAIDCGFAEAYFEAVFLRGIMTPCNHHSSAHIKVK